MKLYFGVLVSGILLASVQSDQETNSSKQDQAAQPVIFRGHYIEDLEPNNVGTEVDYLPPDAGVPPEAGFSIVPIEGHCDDRDSRYDDKWALNDYNPPIMYCETEIHHKTHLEELIDNYADQFGKIDDLDSLKQQAMDATVKVVDDQKMALLASLGLELKEVNYRIPEDRIQTIEFYYSQAKSLIDTVTTDAKEELKAIHTTAKRRTLDIVIHSDPTDSEKASPGLKAHNLKFHVQVLEKLLDSTTIKINQNSEVFRKRATAWYYKKLDEQYEEEIERKKKWGKEAWVVE